jgi:STE24 endopeptidase
MYLYIILALVMAMMAISEAPSSPAPALGTILPEIVAVAALVSLAGLVITAYVLAKRDAIRAGQPVDLTRLLRRIGLAGRLYRLGVALAFALILFELGWSSVVAGLIQPPGGVPPEGPGPWRAPAFLLALAPYFLLLGVSWVAIFWADRALRAVCFQQAGSWAVARQTSLGRYLEFMARQYLLVLLVPLVAVISVEDALDHWLGSPEFEPLVMVIFMGMILGLVMLAGPWVRVCWKTQSLPEGELRDRLRALADRAGVRMADIRVWRTNHTFANGCMIGMAGPVRYIMITDVLLEAMAHVPEEVEAVFAHEVGHAKYRHTTLFMLLAFAAMSAGMIVGLEAAIWVPDAWARRLVEMGVLESADQFGIVLMGAAVLAILGFGFGYVSRRCETEADLYAVRATTCPVGCSPPDAGFGKEPPQSAAGVPAPADDGLCEHRVAAFTGALQRLARLNGMPENRRGWRHFSIANRCALLVGLIAKPGAIHEVRQRLRRVRTVTILASLACILAATALVSGLVSLEPDHPEYPARPQYVPEGDEVLWVRLIDRNQVGGVALRPPELDRQADLSTNLDNSRLAGRGRDVGPAHHEVAVADPRRHAVAIDAKGDGAGSEGGQARQFQVLADAIGRGR